MKIKDVISQTGIPEKTIRYYESQGLIHPVTERRGGRTYHEFRSEDVAALNAIVVLRKAQFSIEEIRTMQQDPEKIPQISAGLRRRIQAEADAMTRLLSVEDVFSAPDYQALSRQIAAAFRSQPDYVPPLPLWGRGPRDAGGESRSHRRLSKAAQPPALDRSDCGPQRPLRHSGCRPGIYGLPRGVGHPRPQRYHRGLGLLHPGPRQSDALQSGWQQ